MSLLRRWLLRTKCRKACLNVILVLVGLYIIYRYFLKGSLSFVKIENADIPLIGDFPCKDSVLPDKCAYHLDPYTRTAFKGKYICALMSACQGFVYNTGLNMVVMKNVVEGFPKYSPGFELYVKTSYSSALNLTMEECAASMQESSIEDSGMACNLPNMDPFDQSLMALFKDKKLECKGTPITTYEDGKLTFMTHGNDVEEVTYETIIRKNHDFGYGVGENGTLTRSKNTVVLNHDAIRLTYRQNGEQQIDFHLGVSPLPDVVSRQGKDPYIPMDIMILAFDSTSRSHFSRKLPLIKEFLLEELNTIIFKGYSIVGDGTTPALLAMFAGKLEEELPEARKAKGGEYVDKWPFIFNKLHQHGYATFFSEDQAKYASFQYRLNGFLNKPVDHWLRSFWLAASEHTGGKEYYCLGTEPGYRKRFRNIQSFYRAYPKRKKFSISFFAIGHDDINSLGYLQDDFLQFLKDMKQSGSLDNTLLVVMGDHGIRYGAIRKTILGKLEERLPLLAMSVPAWFTEQFPGYFHHLQTNAQRLTTPFDLHATFQHILSKTHTKNYKFGQSLFDEIPNSRTCQEAGNPEHFCPCVRWKPVNPLHKHIQQIGEEAVETINKLIKKENLESKCAMLALKKVDNPVYLAPNDQVETFDRSADVDGRVVAKGTRPKGMCTYQIQVMTSPNNGVYEVTGHVSSMTPHVNPQMSRLDEYGDQPKCIMGTHPYMRKYCYCISSS